MSPESMTVKVNEAVQLAAQRALEMQHGSLTAEHLLWALSTQNDTSFTALLRVLDVNQVTLTQGGNISNSALTNFVLKQNGTVKRKIRGVKSGLNR
jgi:ATP-dependent Clp protease ATP-binding subunit ClpA